MPSRKPRPENTNRKSTLFSIVYNAVVDSVIFHFFKFTRVNLLTLYM